MRKIKFRVWYGEEQRYVSPSGCTLNTDGIFDVDNSVVIEQYTGLKDRRGVEIYEGDLLKVCDNNAGYLEVVFRNQYVGGWVLTHSSTDDVLSLGARSKNVIEVVGNIHENPELLR